MPKIADGAYHSVLDTEAEIDDAEWRGASVLAGLNGGMPLDIVLVETSHPQARAEWVQSALQYKATQFGQERNGLSEGWPEEIARVAPECEHGNAGI
jgi:hypothetical protein